MNLFCTLPSLRRFNSGRYRRSWSPIALWSGHVWNTDFW